MTDTEMTRLEKKCDEMSQTLTAVRDWQIGFDVRAVQIDRDVRELQGTVFGNGVPGLKARMQGQEDKCRSHLESQSGTRAFVARVAQTVVSAMILTVIFWLMGVFKTGQ